MVFDLWRANDPYVQLVLRRAVVDCSQGSGAPVAGLFWGSGKHEASVHDTSSAH